MIRHGSRLPWRTVSQEINGVYEQQQQEAKRPPVAKMWIALIQGKKHTSTDVYAAYKISQKHYNAKL